jgi:drug/metabolite transporter (DMT)-like permease
VGSGRLANVTTELEAPVTRSTSRARGTLLIVVASVCFGTSGPFAKPMMDAGLRPEQVATMRIVLAAAVLLLAVGLIKPSVLRVNRREWRLIGVYGLVGVAAVQLVYFIAVSRIPVGIAMLLEFTSPILVALWVRFVRGTILPLWAWVGTWLAFAGLAMVAQVWQGLSFDTVGMLAAVAGAFGAAGYFLIGERGVSAVHPLGLVTWGLVIGAVAVCVVVPPWNIPVRILGDTTKFGPWHPPVWTLLCGVVLISTAMAYLLSISAMRHLPSHVVSVLALVEPIVATAAAWAFLDQTLTVTQVTGAVVLLGGATLVQVASSARGELALTG